MPGVNFFGSTVRPGEMQDALKFSDTNKRNNNADKANDGKKPKFIDYVNKASKPDKTARTPLNKASAKVQTEMQFAENKITDSKVQEQYQKAKSDFAGKVANHIKDERSSIDNEDGTDLALKDMSKRLEAQILGIMWNLALEMQDRNYQGGLGEEIFYKELVAELAKPKGGEMSDLANSIYNDLKQEEVSKR